MTLPATQKADPLDAFVEADETFLPHSFKGQRHLNGPPRRRGKQIQRRGPGRDQVPVLVVRDLLGATADFKRAQIDTPRVESHLRPLLAPDAILCSDGAAAYRTVAWDLGMTHRPVNFYQRIRVIAGVYHTQNVNAYDSRLKTRMRRFHGVATKYLENDLGWRRWLERFGEKATGSTGGGRRPGFRAAISTIGADVALLFGLVNRFC